MKMDEDQEYNPWSQVVEAIKDAKWRACEYDISRSDFVRAFLWILPDQERRRLVKAYAVRDYDFEDDALWGLVRRFAGTDAGIPLVIRPVCRLLRDINPKSDSERSVPIMEVGFGSGPMLALRDRRFVQELLESGINAEGQDIETGILYMLAEDIDRDELSVEPIAPYAW
jgi:hypothetical protein